MWAMSQPLAIFLKEASRIKHHQSFAYHLLFVFVFLTLSKIVKKDTKSPSHNHQKKIKKIK
jgi:hypothetical protein